MTRYSVTRSKTGSKTHVSPFGSGWAVCGTKAVRVLVTRENEEVARGYARNLSGAILCEKCFQAR